MAWQKGPLPPGTWNWGGVALKGATFATGFYFADFHGDHVILDNGKRIEAADVAWYDNSITLPPVEGVKERSKGD